MASRSMHGYHTGALSLDPSMCYVYGDPDHYLGAHSSASQSPLNSPYDTQVYIPDFSASDAYSSPDRETASPETPSNAQTKTPAKRKRENRYKNAPPSVLSRRRAQNRASQRAYRERKDQRIKDLEQMLGDAKQRNETLTQAYAELQDEYAKLKTAQYQEQAYAVSADVAYDQAAANAAVGLGGGGGGGAGGAADYALFAYPNVTTSYQM